MQEQQVARQDKDGGADLRQFIDAVAQNNIGQATALMAASADKRDDAGCHMFVTSATSNGWSAVTVAASYGHTDMMRMLLHAGSPVEMPTNVGETALYAAARCGMLDAVKLLVASKANISATNTKGATACHVAAEKGKWSQLVSQICSWCPGQFGTPAAVFTP